MREEEFVRSLQDYANLRGCPIATGFGILGKRWTIVIIRELLLGSVRFNELLRNAPGINPRMLSLRLKELVDNGLVKRSVSPGTPVGVQYSLSRSGRDLIPVMFAMARFSMKNFPEKVFRDGIDRTPERVRREMEGEKK